MLLGLIAFAAVTHAHDEHDEGDDHEGHDHGDEEEEEAPAGPSEVVVLDESNFDDHVKNNDITLIEFYAPWCGHCKALAPEYDKASLTLKGQSKLAKVDCTEHRDLCEKYEVQGFPTIKLFRNDGSEPADYDQARKADAIVKFMQKQKQPAYQTFKSQKEIDEFVSDDGDIEVIAFIADGDKASTDAFVAVAKALRNDYEFGVVTDASLAKGKRPSAVLYRSFDEPQVTHTGDWTEEALSDFVKGNAFPLVGEIGPENYQKYLERGYPLAWFFIHKDNDKAVLTAATEAAKDFRNQISFVWLDGVRWADHAKTFGLSGATPGVVIEDRDNRKNYVFPQSSDASSAAALKAHFRGFVDKTLAPTVKSEEPPASNNGPVKVVVGKTFESIVLDNTKDVLVEFYAPWCGHCKSLAPKYEKLGESFKASESIVIAKIDATENDTPVDIRGFPTIMFYPADDKANPLTYEGDRTEQAMAQFVRENASTLKKAGGAKAAGSGHDEL
jgi:protein disulfide-isomerase A1